ncbi:1-acyl-sn-glycerol-3-phosphate acyltransferase [Neolewinella antarctica]|uniref:1-acyl-sn-glycerol-3-phosphate acyltransferase n=1 Tax=Neolewinella antarctica TaxID=442734 RepID=A0ABX0XCB6_9BACT|nr:1-acyl-sn-glycerol-3-phosphate acyltransferase [Neolewinella antarctica]NJC26921.1 1-acyl-sn-glycerol-3-phosphate acyltransferase [Neolewinella antarctica]
MLYFIVRPVVRYVFKYYFRDIQLSGLENIPKNGAVILAANHPTGFLEPCIMACFQSRNLHFLARGDLYKNALATATLRALNILPVYRLKDGGFGKLRNNFSTFDDCFRVLSDRKAVMIMAEGSCIHEKALRPLVKGTARIALGALEADATLPEVYVLPVGVNFTRAERVRSDVMIRCGEPILASDYLRGYRASPNAALSEFTRHLRQRLQPLIVQFPSRGVSAAGEILLDAHRPATLDREIELAAKTDQHVETAGKLATLLQQTGVEMGAVAGATEGVKSKDILARPIWELALSLVAVLIQLPIFPIWLLAQYIATAKVNTIEFYNPVRFTVVAVSTLVLFPIGLLVLPWLFKIWIVLAVLTVKPAIRQWEKIYEWHQQRKFEQLEPLDKSQLIKHYQAIQMSSVEESQVRTST